MKDECPQSPTGEHEFEFHDDSFDHEFGTEHIYYWQCEHCDETKPHNEPDPEPDYDDY